VPQYRAFVEYSLHLNGMADRVSVVGSVVSQQRGAMLEMVVPARGIWGTAGIDGLNIDRAVNSGCDTGQAAGQAPPTHPPTHEMGSASTARGGAS
jgi:hypothetical protein